MVIFCSVEASQDSLESWSSSGFVAPESVVSPDSCDENLFDMISGPAGLMSELDDIADTSIPTIEELL